MAKVYFFGYGANRSRKRIKEILGKEPDGGYGAVINGYTLSYQVLDQVPENPRRILDKVWGENFKGYTLSQGGGKVAGVIWEIEEEDLKKIKQWEFVDEGWKELVRATANTSDGRSITVLTEKAVETLPRKEAVDGLHYEDNLNKGEPYVSEDDEFRMKEMEKIKAELKEYQQQLRS